MDTITGQEVNKNIDRKLQRMIDPDLEDQRGWKANPPRPVRGVLLGNDDRGPIYRGKVECSSMDCLTEDVAGALELLTIEFETLTGTQLGPHLNAKIKGGIVL